MAGICAVEIRPHCAAEEIDAIDAELFIKEQIHLRMIGCKPSSELLIFLVHRFARIVFMVSRDIENGLLPAAQQSVNGAVILECDDVARKDENVPFGIRWQGHAGAELKVKITGLWPDFQALSIRVGACFPVIAVSIPYTMPYLESGPSAPLSGMSHGHRVDGSFDGHV